MSGNVDTAFLAASQQARLTSLEGQIVEIELQDPSVLRQYAVLVGDHPRASAFLAFLASDTAEAILTEQGYQLP